MARYWCWLLFVSALCQAEPSKSSIRLGMSAPVSGQAAELGKSYRDGAQLVFQRLNIEGGIDGRPIELVCVDDGYEPLRTVENTRQFLQDPKMFALFGYVGTPTVNAALPLLRKNKLPFIAPFTGAQLIRQADDTFVYNFRASYAEEVQHQLKQLVDRQGYRRIALLIQADEFGASVEQHILEGMQQRQLQPVAISRYQRNTHDLSHAIQQLKTPQPDLVIMVGHYQALAQAIEWGQHNDFNPVYSVVSFTGVMPFVNKLKAPFHLYASTVLPMPHPQAPHPLVQAYLHAAVQAGYKPSDVSFEGYVSASLFVSALKACQPTLTRECVLQQLPLQTLPGFALAYDVNTHQASHQVFFYHITPTALSLADNL